MTSTHERPLYLYKYRSMRPAKTRRNTERIFLHRALYFGVAAEFNDPFECRVRLSLSASPAELDSAVRSGQLSREMADRIRLSSQVREYREGLEAVSRDIEDDLPNSAAVLSLTEKRDDILMWSHYGDDHRGICLGFDSNQDFFVDAKPVTYTDKLPTVNFVRESPEELALTALLTKSSNWAYESEWRLAGASKRGREITYPPSSLKEVIFGARISSEDRLHFADLAKSVSGAVRFFQANRKKEDYGLEIAPAKG